MTAQITKPLGVTLRGESAEFRVWAPHAASVSVCGTFSDMQPVAMVSESDGNWSITLKAQAGQEYFYMVDTGQGNPIKRIDPRARSLTASDRGMGIIVDDEFDWQGDNFTPPAPHEQIIYELHIGTFNRTDPATPGTFNDAIEQLDYLQELGINMIELMPVSSMAFSSGWGYAPLYPFSVESTYGGRAGCMKFVRECHKRGIGVIHDVVYNHLYGDTDLWRFDGWYEGDNGGGIYFYNDARVETPWGGRPDFGRPEVRDYFADNVQMWLEEYRMDGLRIDSTIYMRNTEGRDSDPEHDIPEVWTFMGELTARAKQVKPSAILIAEDSSGNAQLTAAVDKGGCGFDAQWELGYPHAIRDALELTPDKPPTLDTFAWALGHTYSDNPFQKVIFSDSHDTAANGSARINQVATPRDAASLFARQTTLLASALALTGPGIPMLLQGQEFMQEGAFNDWQELEWDKRDTHAGIVLAHRHLIDLRRNTYHHTAGLLGNHTELIHRDDANRVVGYRRFDDEGNDVVIIANFSNQQLHDYHIRFPTAGTWMTRFNASWHGYSADLPETPLQSVGTAADNDGVLQLAPYGILIFSRE